MTKNIQKRNTNQIYFALEVANLFRIPMLNSRENPSTPTLQTQHPYPSTPPPFNFPDIRVN